MIPDLSGIHMMLPTPFDEQGNLEGDSIPKLVSLAEKAGCAGVVCLGEMGEHARLSENERDYIVSTVTRSAKGRLNVTVGATGQSTHLAMSNVEQAQAHGADAVMVAPPIMRKPNLEAVYNYYEAINEFPITLIIQDFPETNGVFMTPGFIERLHKNLEHAKYLKLEDPPTPPKVTSVKALTGETMGIFGGLGGLYFLEELLRGACGTMTGFAFPEILVQVYDYVLANKKDQARQLFFHNIPLIRYEAQQGISLNIRKELFRKRGALAFSTVRSPSPSIDGNTLSELDEILRYLDLEP